ncbi:unnamed protein product, partial [Mesorhabditis spiculigera]
MGCRLSRTDSLDRIDAKDPQATTALHPAKAATSEKRTNGSSVLTRRDTPQSLPLQEAKKDPTDRGVNGIVPGVVSTKPIAEVESASQADFFRMLDEKIAHGIELEETPSEA